MLLAAASTAFPQSAFLPFAVGLFGLGTTYFVWGGQTIFGFPKAEGEAKMAVEQTAGLWGVWMGGFMQFITGVWLFTGLTWFPVFTGNSDKSVVYMAALAFTAYGVHWFVMGHRRFIGASPMPDAWMTIAYAWLSIIGVIVFLIAADIPVAIVFILLALIYLSELGGRFFNWQLGLKLQGVWQLLNGIWLMYLTFAFTLAFANGIKLWL